ncbi:MAG: YdbL family protein [Deltaproteobacteria bacterium]|jgi:uncharacterized protein YdbL (DUF1318 family)|nr:YdbL family protein [Deltaproteobacteria bacterium]
MRKKVLIATIPVSLTILLISGVLVFAGSEEIKARMKARLPVINALKADGIIGENNGGYLEFIQNTKPKKNVLDAENQDRRQVYSAIAKQQGVSIDLVEKRRAKQIAERANPGQWIQDSSGKWFQKQ